MYSFILFQSGVSVARFKPAIQLNDLIYGWTWSADKAVDGCYLRDDPNNVNDQCCATSDATTDNYWEVNLLGQYLVDQIVIYSRGDGK